ncbi:hypothetical protein Barb7_02690 [Bacteroidales bacterium Barb7]|nr:hypothetical protein Barb7_02690 [Bacteroidales bacterium Barb7]
MPVLDIADKQHLVLNGREQESIDASFVSADLPAVGAVDIHHPYLRVSAFGRQESNLPAAVYPYGILFAFRGESKLPLVRTVQVDNEQLPVPLILFDTHKRHAVEHLCPVG